MLSTEQRQTFDRDGYLVLDQLLDEATVDAVCARFSQAVQEAGADGAHPRIPLAFEPGQAISDDPQQRELAVRKFWSFAERDPFFWDLFRSPRLVEPVSDIIGSGVRLLQSMALVKPPAVGGPKEWHQDVPYFPIEPKSEALGLWIALDDATLENGCMQVVPGSHKLGEQPHERGDTGWRLPQATVDAHRQDVLAIPVTRGGALLFHGALFHFTDHNHSAHRRRALQFHYVSARTVSSSKQLFELDSERPPLEPKRVA